MEEISFNGEKYLKASVIADKFGYTSDYVGQLCRAKQIKATLVGRSWYVTEESVREHKKGRHRSTLVKSKQAMRQIAVDQKHRPPTTPRYLNRVASYETDEADLLPIVAKPVKNSDEAKSDVIVDNVEKHSYVSASEDDLSPKISKIREEHHQAVRIIKAADNMAARHRPVGPGAISGIRKTPDAQKSTVRHTGSRRRRSTPLRHFVATTLLSLAIIFLSGSLFLEKQILVTASSEITTLYRVSGEGLSKNITKFLSTYLSF